MPLSAAAVRGYTADVVGCSPDRVTAVCRFEDGNRHAVYRVAYLGPGDAANDVVVRVSYGGDADECAQAEREARVLQTVGGLAAPVLHDFRRTCQWFDTPVMCMAFAPGEPRELRSVSRADMERLGSVVAWVHGRPTEDLAASLAATGDIDTYAEIRLRSIVAGRSWVRDPLPVDMQARLRSAADCVERTLYGRCDGARPAGRDRLALLHGDIGPANVLWGPEPVLIDWEYARLGDPADEIAYLFDQNGLTALQREAFWHGYRQGVTSELQLTRVVARVDWWEPVTLLGSTFWWVERWMRRTDADRTGTADAAVPRQADYYFEHVARRADRLDKLLG